MAKSRTPAGPVLPAILAWSEYKGATGAELLHALVMGAVLPQG